MKQSSFLFSMFTTALIAAACGGGGSDKSGDGDGDSAGDGDTAGDGDGGANAGDGDVVGDGDGDVIGDGDAAGGQGGGSGGSTPADPSAPVCSITSPSAGADLPYSGFFAPAFSLTATATDAEDGDLSGASVVWRASGVTEPLGSGLAISVDEIPPGEYEISCTATDSDSKTGTSSVSVTVYSPVAQINHPGAADGPRVQGSDFPFSGVAKDFEDGELNPDTFEWSSSIDGALSNPVDSTGLSAGTHTITMTATDSDSNDGSGTVDVELE